jgi:hypothetical protein
MKNHTKSLKQKNNMAGTAEPTYGRDFCCWSRSKRDFDDGMNTHSLSRYQVTLLLRINQYSFLTLVSFQCVIEILWVLAGGYIPNFVLYDGAASSVNAYSHTGVWQVLDFITIAFGLIATYFGLNYSSTTGRIERGVQRTLTWVAWYRLILLFNFANHVTHAVLTGFEAVVCTSSLCLNSNWAMWTLFALLIVSALLNGWLLLRIQVYYNNLKYASNMDKLDLDVSGPSKSSDFDNEASAPPTPSAPPSADLTVKGRIRTPLLVASRHGGGTRK